MTYLIDTNIVIDHLRNEAKATNLLKEVEAGTLNALISVITEYELLASKRISPEEQAAVKLLLSLLPSRSVTSKVVTKAAEFHRKYDTDIADALIAATAWATKAVLITRNLKHFQNIKELKVKSV